LPCVTIEAALFHCHKEVGGKVHVGEIAKTVNATLNGRGEPTEFEAKVIGGILGSLGLVAKRDGQGYAIRLDEKARRFIHELARRFDVAAAQEKITLCPLCIEILATNNTGSKPL